MTWAAYVFALSFLAALGELVLDSYGVSLPFVAIACFYLTVALGIGAGGFCAVFGGASLDFVLGREHPLSVPLLLVVAGLALLWLYKFESKSMLFLCVPGAALPFIVWVPVAFLERSYGSGWLPGLLLQFSDAAVASVCSALLLPGMALLVDGLGQRLEMGLFTEAKDRLARDT